MAIPGLVRQVPLGFCGAGPGTAATAIADLPIAAAATHPMGATATVFVWSAVLDFILYSGFLFSVFWDFSEF